MVIRAPAALEYARSHLTLLPPPEHVEDQSLYGPAGWSEWVCPKTAIRWHGNVWTDGVELRRRPETRRSDYDKRGVIRTRADEVNAAHAEVDRWFGKDPERHRAATERLWRAMAALYSPEWDEIVAGLQIGARESIAPAVVFLEADPRCDRSGYVKERLCRLLALLDLPVPARRALGRLAPRMISDSSRPERERKAWRRLAEALASQT